jgi:MoxR-vWA-beta-propeller ternary system domain bpX2
LKTILEHVTCARLPAPSLASLAGLRRVEGISVLAEGDHAWVFWEPGDDRVLRALLPVAGVKFYEERDGAWHRPGRKLPTFGIPPLGERVPLDRAVTPEPFEAESPGRDLARPSTLRLARDGRPRPTSAALCPLAELGSWADSAPSAEIVSIRGAFRGDSALLLGRGLPPWPGSTRYWGHRVLVPIGFQPRPCLPEEAILEALGASGEEIFRLVPGTTGDEGLTVEAIPLGAFRPLSRAGVRLARGART